MPKKIYIRTFGCQMNFRDSEIVRGALERAGYRLSDDAQGADIVLFNTCSVRAHAEHRAVSNLAAIARKKPRRIFGLIGCVAEHRKESLFKSIPNLDIICGPRRIYEISELIARVQGGEKRVTAFNDERLLRPCCFALRSKASGARNDGVGAINYAPRNDGVSGFVKISEGCDNYCSYCIVPYVRGAMRSRQAAEILNEIRGMVAAGTTEIMLLGQNVNSYGQDLEPRTNFVGLLKQIDTIRGLRRIKFMTSHPKDAHNDLFETIAELDKMDKALHLPLQSGSNRILKMMNRGYTFEKYLDLVHNYRRFVPEGRLTTDIIVGFPGETDQDFDLTKKVMEQIQFDAAYIFKYSPRPPAKSSEMKDDVPMEVKKKRNNILLEIVRGCAAASLIVFLMILSGCATAPRGDGMTFTRPGLNRFHELYLARRYDAAVREGKTYLDSAEAEEKPEVQYLIGLCLLKSSDYEEARAYFEGVLKGRGPAILKEKAYIGVGDAYFTGGLYQRSYDQYRQFLVDYPQSQISSTAYFKLAQACRQLRRDEEARFFLEKLKEKYPDSPEARLQNGQNGDGSIFLGKIEPSPFPFFYTVQVGSFKMRDNAATLCAKLKAKGYDAYTLEEYDHRGKMYKVRIGKFSSEDQARLFSSSLQAKEHLNCSILKINSESSP